MAGTWRSSVSFGMGWQRSSKRHAGTEEQQPRGIEERSFMFTVRSWLESDSCDLDAAMLLSIFVRERILDVCYVRIPTTSRWRAYGSIEVSQRETDRQVVVRVRDERGDV